MLLRIAFTNLKNSPVGSFRPSLASERKKVSRNPLLNSSCTPWPLCPRLQIFPLSVPCRLGLLWVFTVNLSASNEARMRLPTSLSKPPRKTIAGSLSSPWIVTTRGDAVIRATQCGSSNPALVMCRTALPFSLDSLEHVKGEIVSRDGFREFRCAWFNSSPVRCDYDRSVTAFSPAHEEICALLLFPSKLQKNLVLVSHG